MELFDGLDDVDSAILRRVLKGLLNGNEKPARQIPSQAGGDQQGLSLPQLLDLVERAAGGDHELGGKLFPMLQQLSRADEKEISMLGNVLLRVLVGERNPDLSALPDESTSAIRGLLGRLKH
jgi:hypothetical protein